MDILYYILGMLFNICFTVVLIAMVFVLAVTSFNFGTQLFVENLAGREDNEVIIEILDGSDTMAVAELLQRHGLIEDGAVNRWVFVLQARLNGSYKFFRSDTFVLNTNMGSAEIMEALQSIPEPVKGDEVRVIIYEGMTINQIADYVQQLGLFTRREFLEAAQADYPHFFLRDVPDRPNRLQGYLFPDTYILPENPRPEDLIVRMLNQFENVFYGSFVYQPDSLLTVDDIVTIASIIEKETQHHNERELVSAVIHNRMARNWLLNMPSTVLYFRDKPRSQLVSDDLLIASQYNTFLRHTVPAGLTSSPLRLGLPVGPISSPGLRSLEAAMHPANENYLHMVMTANGTHLFTSDYNEYTRFKEEAGQIW
jgi:UPF0755 protein